MASSGNHERITTDSATSVGAPTPALTLTTTMMIADSVETRTTNSANGNKKRPRIYREAQDITPHFLTLDDEKEGDDYNNNNIAMQQGENWFVVGEHGGRRKQQRGNSEPGFSSISFPTCLASTNVEAKAASQEQLVDLLHESGFEEETVAPCREEGTAPQPSISASCSCHSAASDPSAFAGDFVSLVEAVAEEGRASLPRHTVRDSARTVQDIFPMEHEIHFPPLESQGRSLRRSSSSSSSSSSPRRLRELLHARQYDAAMRRVAQQPQEAILSSFSLVPPRLTVLYNLVHDDYVPLEVVQSFLEASIPLLQERNFLGQTPLHTWVMSKLYSPDKNKIIRLILEQCPHLVFETTLEGKTVLDVFAQVWTWRTTEPRRRSRSSSSTSWEDAFVAAEFFFHNMGDDNHPSLNPCRELLRVLENNNNNTNGNSSSDTCENGNNGHQAQRLCKQDMTPQLECLVERYEILLRAAWKHQKCQQEEEEEEEQQQQEQQQRKRRKDHAFAAHDAAQWQSRAVSGNQSSACCDMHERNHNGSLDSPNLLQCAMASPCYVPLSFVRLAAKLSSSRAGWSRDEKGRVPLSMALISATHYNNNNNKKNVPSRCTEEQEPQTPLLLQQQQQQQQQHQHHQPHEWQRQHRSPGEIINPPVVPLAQGRAPFFGDDLFQQSAQQEQELGDFFPPELVNDDDHQDDDDDDDDVKVPIELPISFLIQEYRGAASVADFKGRLPLHIALDCGMLGWHSGIKEIFMDAPKALNQRDGETKLYPFQLALVGRREDPQDVSGTKLLEIAFQLLRANPANLLTAL